MKGPKTKTHRQFKPGQLPPSPPPPPKPADPKQLVVCEYSPYPHPLNDDGTRCKFPRSVSTLETGFCDRDGYPNWHEHESAHKQLPSCVNWKLWPPPAVKVGTEHMPPPPEHVSDKLRIAQLNAQLDKAEAAIKELESRVKRSEDLVIKYKKAVVDHLHYDMNAILSDTPENMMRTALRAAEKLANDRGDLLDKCEKAILEVRLARSATNWDNLKEIHALLISDREGRK